MIETIKRKRKDDRGNGKDRGERLRNSKIERERDSKRKIEKRKERRKRERGCEK